MSPLEKLKLIEHFERDEDIDKFLAIRKRILPGNQQHRFRVSELIFESYEASWQGT
jgi:hypothetical protein